VSWRGRLGSWIGGAALTAPAPPPLQPTPPAAAVFPVREAAATDANDERNGFRRIGGPSSQIPYFRDLFPALHDRMLRMAPLQWQRNPLAKWLIETTVDFVLGEGARVESEVDEVREVIDGFWGDPVNNLDLNLDPFIRDFGLYGELCLPVAVNEVDGHVRLGVLDPFDIEQVITDPDNSLITRAVILKTTIVGGSKRVLKVIREETWRGSPYYGLLMPAEPGERDLHTGRAYDGSCFLFQTNKLTTAKRGLSDIVADLDWLDGYDRWLFGTMDAAELFNTFVWDVTLEAMNEQQIKDWVTTFAGQIQRNGVFAHNEKLKLQASQPKLEALDKDSFARLFRGHILGSHSFPEHWYGLAGEVNLASAKEMGLPPVKRLTRRQKELRFIIRELVRFAIHQAVRYQVLAPEVVIGKVDGAGSSKGMRVPSDQAFKIILPELSMRDQSAIVAAVTSLVSALMQAKAEGWIRPQTAARVFAHLASQLGLEIDADQEYTPGVPAGDATRDYEQLARLVAQLQRQGNGNGDNVNEPKRTTPKGGNAAESLEALLGALEAQLRPLHVGLANAEARAGRAEEAAERAAAHQPVVNVTTPPVTVEAPVVTVHLPETRAMVREVQRDGKNLITKIVDRPEGA
jgi:hypothetical protein